MNRGYQLGHALGNPNQTAGLQNHGTYANVVDGG
jgi:hypothetical protein